MAVEWCNRDGVGESTLRNDPVFARKTLPFCMKPFLHETMETQHFEGGHAAKRMQSLSSLISAGVQSAATAAAARGRQAGSGVQEDDDEDDAMTHHG
jgi:hypothetical protein